MERITTLLEELKAIEPRLSFQCIVKGKVLTARVTGRLNYEVLTGYRDKWYVGSERKGAKPANPETARNSSLLIEAAQ